jgi:hypothetical protein
MARDTAASSEGEILPSPSASKRENTFRISASCPADRDAGGACRLRICFWPLLDMVARRAS